MIEVFPAPRKPVNTVMGIGEESGEGIVILRLGSVPRQECCLWLCFFWRY